MTLEQLQLKRAGLVAQKDQLAANINATIGAIAMCDELIAAEIVEGAKETPAPAEKSSKLSDDELYKSRPGRTYKKRD